MSGEREGGTEKDGRGVGVGGGVSFALKKIWKFRKKGRWEGENLKGLTDGEKREFG